MSPQSPPARKPNRPPPRKKRRDSVARALQEIESDPEVSGPRAPAPKDDPLEGEWLFKENDVVNGPVAASVLLDGARTGSYDSEMPIAREVGQWRPLHSVSIFADAWEEGQKARQVEQERRALESKRNRMRGFRAAFVLVLFMFPFSACAFMGHTVVAARPWDTSGAWVQKAPPLIELPKKVVEKAPVKVASLSPKRGDEKPTSTNPSPGVDDKGTSDSKSSNRKRRRRKDKAVKKTEATKVAAVAVKPKVKPKAEKKIAEKLSEAQVKSGLKRGFPGIVKCLKAEKKNNPNVPPTVTLEFSINSAGKAIEVKVRERQVRKGPLPGCLRKALGKVKWPRTYGESRYVAIPFKVGKKK